MSHNRALTCDSCNRRIHIKCGQVTPKRYAQLQQLDEFEWSCPECCLVSSVPAPSFLSVNNCHFVHPSCETCSRTIASNHRSLRCASCSNWYHMNCAAVKPAEYGQLGSRRWTCSVCCSRELMENLPFCGADNSFDASIDLQQDAEEMTNCGNGLSDFVKQLEYGTSNKDVRLAHLNVCDLRNKIEELRCLQQLCKFKILAITEAHLNKKVPDTEILIPGMKIVRLDRKGRKGGGCLSYYGEHLHTTHRKDLLTQNIEAEWLQVKFPSSSVLFAVIYRPPDASEFFDLISATLEKSRLKTSHTVLLRDFNCNFKTESEQCPNVRKLRSIFKTFNMQNVVNANTRETLTTSTLLDLIVTTRTDLMGKCGVFRLGISDHNMVYATMNLKNKRPQPKYIKTRDYRKLDAQNFRQDIESVPFHIASVFEEPDDVLWAWQTLFNGICDEHVAQKEVKIRSKSAPWITNEIRYKIFKAAVSTKCPELWSAYKKARNAVTPALRRAKASYFTNMFEEVKKSSAYWNLINKATNRSARNRTIGPLKRTDGSFALMDKEKAQMMNAYFSEIGENLIESLPMPQHFFENQSLFTWHTWNHVLRGCKMIPPSHFP